MTSVDSIRPYGSRLRLLSAILIGVGMAAGVWCAGCASQPRVTPLSRAMFTVRAELRPDYRQAIEVIEEQRHDDRARNEYVLLGMCETSAAMLGGNYETAERASYESFAAVQKYVDEEAAARAALSKESEKFFKGEPHERALLCYYAGLANYVFGKYNEARQYFTQSLYATKTKDDDMADFRDDFRLGYYWLGRAYLMRGETDNARISFRKAAATVPHKGQDREIKQMYSARAKEYKNELKGEAVCFEKSTKGKNPVEGIVDLSKEVTRGALPAALPLAPPQDPTLTRATTLAEFLSLSFQQDVNLIVIVELGQGPLKYARGQHATFDEIKRLPYREASADVYVDGHHSGPAFELLDTYHQAITRGVKTRRGASDNQSSREGNLEPRSLRQLAVGTVERAGGHQVLAYTGRRVSRLCGQGHARPSRPTREVLRH